MCVPTLEKGSEMTDSIWKCACVRVRVYLYLCLFWDTKSSCFTPKILQGRQASWLSLVQGWILMISSRIQLFNCYFGCKYMSVPLQKLKMLLL